MNKVTLKKLSKVLKSNQKTLKKKNVYWILNFKNYQRRN